MYEVSALDHLSIKVDALFQKFDKMSVSNVTPAPVLRPCEVCTIVNHKSHRIWLRRTYMFWEHILSALFDRIIPIRGP